MQMKGEPTTVDKNKDYPILTRTIVQSKINGDGPAWFVQYREAKITYPSSKTEEVDVLTSVF